MNQVDTIALEFEVSGGGDDKNAPPYFLSIDTYVNGEILFSDKKLHLNLPYLENALHKTQKFPIFVCGCGDEGCAGISQTSQIIVKDKYIIWEIYEPKKRTFYFESKQVFDAIEQLKISMLGLCGIESWKKVAYTGATYAHEFFNKRFLARQRTHQKSRKVLKSVAHNYAHFFFSNMNHASYGYVGDYICERVLAKGERVFFYNILAHKMKPSFLHQDKKLVQSLQHCSEDMLYYLLEGVGFKDSKSMIKKATMLVKFMPGTSYQKDRIPSDDIVPFEAQVTLIDENNKVYKGKCNRFCLI